MDTAPKTKLFKKVLVPIVHGCEQVSAVHAARAIVGEGMVMLLGLVYIPEGESLSSGAMQVQEVRQKLRSLSSQKPGSGCLISGIGAQHRR